MCKTTGEIGLKLCNLSVFMAKSPNLPSEITRLKKILNLGKVMPPQVAFLEYFQENIPSRLYFVLYLL